MTAEAGSGPAGDVPLRMRLKARTREEVVAAALALMAVQGYDRTTVDQIARRAGVSSATFFRYFPSKEEVLFAGEQAAEDLAVGLVAGRADTAQTLPALAAPMAAMAESIVAESGSRAHQLTRLVMTTRGLEGRSMRMRLRWERGIARQLARERGAPTPAVDDVLLANIAVGCLAAALWGWQRGDSPESIVAETRTAFATAVRLSAG